MRAAADPMSAVETDTVAQRLRDALAGVGGADDPAGSLRCLVHQGLDVLPMPGSGRTLDRWRALSAVAEHDLSLAKLYEGHTDALAIFNEIGSAVASDWGCRDKFASAPVGAEVIWGVWASEAPGARVTFEAALPRGGDGVLLTGVKHWCSGAKTGTHALLTVWPQEGGTDAKVPQLAWLELAQPGVQVFSDAWKAVGMDGSASLQVQLNNVRAYLVGKPGDYLSRPGFWQGGAGVAACWYGGTTALANTLYRTVQQSPEGLRNPFRMAAVGRVAVMMRGMALTLRDAAAWIDANPRSNASEIALGVRLAAAKCATGVLEEVGGALGATPFCADAAFSRIAADLPVFIRQSHGDRDFAALAQQLLAQGEVPWAL